MPSTGFQDIAISPDGRRIAYRAGGDGAARLYTRALDGTGGRFLPGADLSSPFFSFDGAEIGFYAFETRSLMRTSTLGGSPTRVADSLTYLAGASWSADGRITFATTDPTTGIMRVTASGGEPETLTQPGSGENHVLPEVLLGGRAVLFAVLPAADAGTSPHLAVLDLDSGELQELIPGSHPRFASGYLVYLMGSDLMAVSFDEQRLRVTGSPVVVLEGIEATSGTGQYSLSREGTLLVVMDAGTRRRELVWVDRSGREEPFPAAARNADLSPDGRFIVYQGDETGRFEIYVRSFPNVDDQYLKVSTGGGIQPVWSPRAGELFYIEPGSPSYLTSVRVEGSSTLVVSRPRRLCEWPYYRGELGRTYDVSRPDGERFLAIRMAADASRGEVEQPRVEVVLDWPALLGAGRPR